MAQFLLFSWYIMRYALIAIVTATLFVACQRNVTTPVSPEMSNMNISDKRPVISEDEAKRHIGEKVVVFGTVSVFSPAAKPQMYTYI